MQITGLDHQQVLLAQQREYSLPLLFEQPADEAAFSASALEAGFNVLKGGRFLHLLARLVYPVANPRFNYHFSKGYYSRVTNNSLGGRVTRLLVTPLIRALQHNIGSQESLEYMDSFRYPLAGAFSMSSEVMRVLHMPSDWGLEVGVLMESARNYSTQRICQVEIADNYEHKYQEVSASNEESGFSKMSLDISKAFFRKLATNGVVFELFIP